MIFAVGCIAFLLVVLYYSWRLLQLSRDWQAGTAGYGALKFYEDRKWRWTSIDTAIAIPMQSPMRFTIKRESMVDRVCKWLHLATEFQVGEVSFDTQLYLVCDDAAWCQLLESNPVVQKLIRLVFLSGASELTLNGRALQAEFKSTTYEPGFNQAEMVEWLHELAKHIASYGPYAERTVNSSYKLQSVVLTAVHIGWLVIGSVGLFAAWIHSTSDFPWSALLTRSLSIAGYSAIGWLILIRILMRSSSRCAPTIAHFLTVGLPGLFLITAAARYDVNAEFDKTEPSIYTTKLTAHAMQIHYGRRYWYSGSSRAYSVPTITIEPWRPGETEPEIFELTPEEFNLHIKFYAKAPQLAHYLRIHYRTGRLGYGWIESYELLEPELPKY